MLPRHSRVRSTPLVQLGIAFVIAVGLTVGCSGSEPATTPSGPETRPDSVRPDSVRADSAFPDSLRPDSLLTDSLRLDSLRADSLRPDSLRPGARGADSLRQAAPDTLAGRPEDTSETTRRTRALVDADSLSTFTREGTRLQELLGRVFVRQDSTRLRSQKALRFLERDEFLFTGNVVIYERGDTLTADTVRYDRRAKVGRARSNVRLTDGDVVIRSPSAIYYSEEKRSIFPDSVELVDRTRVLRAREGEYYSEEQRAEFYRDVRLTDPDTYLEADSVTYLRNEETSLARGDVFIERRPDRSATDDDAARTRTFLFGRTARNEEPRRFSRIEGRALLVQLRLDSAGTATDTLIVRAARLEAARTDTLRRLIAIDSVRIWQPSLAATADSVVYDRFPAPEAPDSAAVDPARIDSVSVDAPTARSVPDSLRPAPRADTLAGSVSPDTATSRSAPPDARPRREETRLFQGPSTWIEGTQVTGDSIRVAVRNRSIDTVFVRSNAFAAQRDTAVNRINQLTGKNITAFFRADSLRRIVARPNARAIRFMVGDDGSLTGAAKASGDRIVLRLGGGTVKRVSAYGGVESTYYKADLIPDPFELDGFIWTPEAEPQKDALLDLPGARARLPSLLTTPRDTLRVPATRPDSLAPPDSVGPPDAPPPSVPVDSLRRGMPDSVRTGARPGQRLPNPPGNNRP